MKKLVVLSVIAPVVLGLAACGGNKAADNAVVVTNTDDMNLTDTTNITDENVSDVTANASNVSE
jgi:ABC-type glycerol-3-phosphate transport system substrate-binding protein